MSEQGLLFAPPKWTDDWPAGTRSRDGRGRHGTVERVFETERPAFTVHGMSIEVTYDDGSTCICGLDTGMVAL